MTNIIKINFYIKQLEWSKTTFSDLFEFIMRTALNVVVIFEKKKIKNCHPTVHAEIASYVDRSLYLFGTATICFDQSGCLLMKLCSSLGSLCRCAGEFNLYSIAKTCI